MREEDAQIQAMVDLETTAWDNHDAESLVSLFHPDMGRACKGYAKVDSRWLLIYHTGLLEYRDQRPE